MTEETLTKKTNSQTDREQKQIDREVHTERKIWVKGVNHSLFMRVHVCAVGVYDYILNYVCFGS